MSQDSVTNLADALRGQTKTGSDVDVDSFWVREHAFFLAARQALGVGYGDLLPGRIYTYRRFLDLLRRTVVFESLMDVGCGSGMILHEGHGRGHVVSGIDRSSCAIGFALSLARTFGTCPIVLAHADVTERRGTRLEACDLVVNFGSLEHLATPLQLEFVSAMASLSNKWIATAIPVFESPLFIVMENAEASQRLSQLRYPEQVRAFDVDFDTIASELNLELIETRFIHIAPTSISYQRHVVEEGIPFFVDLCRTASGATTTPIETWLGLEDSLSQADIRPYAWFKYGLFSKR